jgi:hypothetical protein
MTMTHDLRTRFDRLSDRATPLEGAASLERLRGLRARRIRTRRLTAGSVALIVAIAGTAIAVGAFAGDPSSGLTADEPTVSDVLAPQPPVDSTEADVNEAVIRHLLGAVQADWETIYIRETICDNGGTGSKPKGCDTEFTPEERRILAERLADVGRVVFVAGWDDVPNAFGIGERSVFVWLGPLEFHDDRYEVPGSMVCGGLCGTGSIWDVRQRGDRWTVVESAKGAGMWIA